MTSQVHSSKRFIAFIFSAILCVSTSAAFDSAQFVGSGIAQGISIVKNFCSTEAVIPTIMISGFGAFVGGSIIHDFWASRYRDNFYQCIENSKPEIFAASVVLGVLTFGLLYKNINWFKKVNQCTKDKLQKIEDPDGLC